MLLKELGVDVIEAGFPVDSPGDFESVQLIAQQVQGPVICGLARCNKLDYRPSWRKRSSQRAWPNPRLLATSAIHREFKLKMAKKESSAEPLSVALAALTRTNDIEFSPEDASRTELDFLCMVVEAGDQSRCHHRQPSLIRRVFDAGRVFRHHHHCETTCPNIDKAVISVHCQTISA